MYAIKPEWASLQAQFTSLSLNDQLSRISDELEALKQEITTQDSEQTSHLTDSLKLMLRRIQRYIEWTAPDLLPERAEEAEMLVNVSRFVARLLTQKQAWNTGYILADLDRQIQEILEIQRQPEI